MPYGDACRLPCKISVLTWSRWSPIIPIPWINKLSCWFVFLLVRQDEVSRWNFPLTSGSWKGARLHHDSTLGKKDGSAWGCDLFQNHCLVRRSENRFFTTCWQTVYASKLKASFVHKLIQLRCFSGGKLIEMYRIRENFPIAGAENHTITNKTFEYWILTID